MKVKKLTSGLLLCFALISIGFALGKEVTLRRVRPMAPEGGATSMPASGDQVLVYYMYPAIRCVTCNKIEKTAHGIVHEDYAEAVKGGRLKWREVNISENDELAGRYNVASSTVVVVRLKDGREVGFERLDKVWPLAEKPVELTAYIRKAIRAALEGGGSQ
jgi:hypothetical protein